MPARKPKASPVITSALVLAATTLAALPCLGADSTDRSSFLAAGGDEVAIRSGAGLDWYVVARLDEGAIVESQGTLDDWFTVGYPEGTPAVVKLTEAELRAADGTVVLTRRSSLLAYNLLNPFMEDCYKRLFVDSQLPPGTELQYLGPVENRRGDLAGYKVVAPAGARGYVLPANVRAATAEEIAALEPVDLRETDADALAEQTADDAEAESTPSLRSDQPLASAPDDEQPEPAATKTAERPEPAHPRPTAAPRGRRTLEDIDAAYRRVMDQSIETAEFDQLIREYQDFRAALPKGDDFDIERDYVDKRIELIRIRAELQSEYRKLADLESAAGQTEDDLGQFVERVTAAQGYIVVGKLTASIIYDGQRLPLMYRVVAADDATGGRTLAYVLPDQNLNLVSKLGSLVGVMGDDDPAARRGEVRVIRPSKVEVLTSGVADKAAQPAKVTDAADAE